MVVGDGAFMRMYCVDAVWYLFLSFFLHFGLGRIVGKFVGLWLGAVVYLNVLATGILDILFIAYSILFCL